MRYLGNAMRGISAIIIILLTKIYKSEYINKCCPKGMQLAADMKSCATIAGVQSSNRTFEMLISPIDRKMHYWLPGSFRNGSHSVFYNTLQDLRGDVFGVRSYENLEKKRDYLQNIKGKISSSFIDFEEGCYDTYDNNERRLIEITAYNLKPIHKCCGKGDIFDLETTDCKTRPDLRNTYNTNEEIFGLPRKKYFLRWFPSNDFKYIIKVLYGLRERYNFNLVIPTNKYFKWKFLEEEPFTYKGISFQGRNINGKEVAGVTEIFCFDEILKSKGFSRVMLAAVYRATKCCKRGQQFSLKPQIEMENQTTEEDDFSSEIDSSQNEFCSQRRGQKIDSVENGFVDYVKDPEDAIWLPRYLRNGSISVQYNVMGKMKRLFEQVRYIFNENLWTVNGGNGSTFPRLILNLTDFEGKQFFVSTTHFCFDFMEGVGRVVVTDVPKLISIPKCCEDAEAISADGRCVRRSGVGWAPELSHVFSKWEAPWERVSPVPTPALCHRGRLQILDMSSPQAQDHFQGVHVVESKTRITAFCNDWQLSATGEVREVVAACTYVGLAAAHAWVRPLGAVAAAVAGAAAVAVMARADTRRTAHGRALACHALCLALANALHVAWYFRWRAVLSECSAHAFATYFFMVAANWWLSVITVNVYINFRQPLGALAAGAQRGSSSREWRKFLAMCAGAWGGASALTALSVLMYRHRHSLQRRGFVVPSFYETRSCPFTSSEKMDDIQYAYWRELRQRPLGSVCFYFAPMAALAGANTVLVGLTMRKLRALKTDAAILRGPQMQLALVYVKMLLTSGLLELLLEVAVWAVGRTALQTSRTEAEHRAASDYWFLLMENIYIFEMASTGVDVGRAGCVLWLAAPWRGSLRGPWRRRLPWRWPWWGSGAPWGGLHLAGSRGGGAVGMQPAQSPAPAPPSSGVTEEATPTSGDAN